MNTTRRDFLATATKGVAAASVAPLLFSSLGEPLYAGNTEPTTSSNIPDMQPENLEANKEHYHIPHKIGMGGVALGNAFFETPDQQAYDTMKAAWDAGIRYFDTSPWYGLGLSERRIGHFLRDKDKKDYVISTKVGRLTYPDAAFKHDMWKGRLNFNYKYDYSADGVRRSVEDSLQRLGIPALDVVFIHDLSPDNKDLGDKWEDYFRIAQNGAMKELTKMREEGIIKGWGLGVNTIAPALKTLEVADPDVFLSATKYSLIYHKDALNQLFPACEKRGVTLVSGAPLNAGFLAGVERYHYDGKLPQEHIAKREKLRNVAKDHNVDLRTAALQFTVAPKVMAATIPGARSPKQVHENAESMKAKIPADFWKELKKEKLIEENAPVPA